MLDTLLIFVEGPDDSKFFDDKIKPFFENRYDTVNSVEYSKSNKDQIVRIIRTLEDRYDCEYIFTHDFDDLHKLAAERQHNTQSDRKLAEHLKKKTTKLKTQYEIRDEIHINFVVIEIESWYFAGISNDYCLENHLPSVNSTDGVTKEQFYQLMRRSMKDPSLFLDEILDCFDYQNAMRKNKSFRDFLQKYNCHVSAMQV